MNQLPAIVDAQMPVLYSEAKTALAECERVDECKDWADKSLALAAYAKQANDDELLALSNRIKARAVRRMGELFNQIEPEKGGRPKTGTAADPSSRKQAQDEAGISDRQRKQAQRVAGIPKDEFEKAVESEMPPTVTALANLGKKDAALTRKSTDALGTLKSFAKFCDDTDPDDLAGFLLEHEWPTAIKNAEVIVGWLNKLMEAKASCTQTKI